MLKYSISLTLLLFIFNASPAQVKVDLKIGDTLVFLHAKDENSYRFMDIFVKTRFVNDNTTYDKQTGEGFYDYFFMSGDFDMQRLPKSYKDKTCRIVSFREMQDKDKSKPPRMVAFGLIDDRTVVWIELDNALQSGEIGLQP
jgi:hypothetical protein